MAFLRSKTTMCPGQHCSEWARVYMEYCLCSVRDGVSLSLGMLSVLSWGVAEIPQIVTNYKTKSTEGLSIAFLMTWIAGDLFNVFGCMLEPATMLIPTLVIPENSRQSDMWWLFLLQFIHWADSKGKKKDYNFIYGCCIIFVIAFRSFCYIRGVIHSYCDAFIAFNFKLPTQYYMAMLYTVTTTILTSQAVYYTHIYHRLKCNRGQPQTEKSGKLRQGNNDADACVHNVDKWRNGCNTFDRMSTLSLPIPLPAHQDISSKREELYYMSARSLSSSHTATAGSFLAQPPSFVIKGSIEEPLLGGGVETQSAPSLNIKTMLCVVSAVTFFGTLNLHQASNDRFGAMFNNKSQEFVIRVGRKLLQENSGLVLGISTEASSGIGTFLGWAMAAIYMGGRLPQIYLNIKRGHLEGLNPFMFVFALVGNGTYVASILVSSLEWVHIRPNLPWLVDAGGCVLLDTFILLQFFHFRCRSKTEDKREK